MESVEIIEITWKIPDVRHSVSDKHCHPVRSPRTFFVGGRSPPHDHLFEKPVKLAVYLSEVCELSENRGLQCQWFLVCLPSPGFGTLPWSQCNFQGRLLQLKTFDDRKETVIKEMNGNESGPIDKRITNENDPAKYLLFDQSDAANHIDERDGSLSIYFKLEITIPLPNRDAVNIPRDLSELLSDYESLLKDPTNADFEIKVSLGEEQFRSFRCHKAILAARSPIFRAMFASGMKEATQNFVEVNDILPKPMEHLLSFIYTQRFADSSWIQWLPQLAIASDKYCVKSLKSLCDSNLIQVVTGENALTLGLLAERHGLGGAVDDIRDFFVDCKDYVVFDIIDINTQDEDFNVNYSIPSH